MDGAATGLKADAHRETAMAGENMDEILEQARRLGERIREHPSYKRLRETDARVREDKDAAEALNAYNKAATDIQAKERKGQPIEVEEKRNLEALRDAVVSSETIKAFSQAQADYADLMRRMNEAIFQAIAGPDAKAAAETAPAGGGPSIVTPD